MKNKMKNKTIGGLAGLILTASVGFNCNPSGMDSDCQAVIDAAGSSLGSGTAAIYTSKGYALVSDNPPQKSPYEDMCPSGCEYVGETKTKYCCWCPD